MSSVILITGTPGTGKTTVAKLLAKKLDGVYLSVNDIARKYDSFVSFDKERNSWVVDEEELSNHIVQLIATLTKKKTAFIILDTHFGEIIPDKYTSFIFVLRTHPQELEKRLKKRNWPDNKIRENIQAEILGVVAYNVLQTFSSEKLFEIDTTKKTPIEVVNIILKIISLSDEKFNEKYKIGTIDWLDDSAISSFF